MVMTNESEDRSEIAFFDVETTIPTRPGQGYAILEFGVIWVCPRKLVELRHYTSLVRPKDLSQISSRSVQCNGITKEEVASAPSFSEIADTVYNILHGRIWAGHNILRFDCVRIREAFAEINRPPPEPKGTIDSLALLTQRFGRRAGDMKMATLATYFGLGEQIHRSLDDVRMNLEVVKCCATVLFLESSLPDIFAENSWISPYSATRNLSDIKKSTDQTQQSESTPRPTISIENVSTSFSPNLSMSEDHLIRCFMTPNSGKTNLHQNIEPTSERPGPFNMETLRSEIENEPLPEDNTEDENIVSSPEESSSSAHYESSNGFNDFSEPDKISIPSISATLAYTYPGIHRIQILHNNRPLQLKCSLLKIRFGISTKYVDYAGRPRLSILVNASRDLCSILDVVNELAQKQSVDSGSFSEWRPVVNRNPGYYNFPAIRLHLPTSSDGEGTRLITEIYHKDYCSNTERRVCSRYDVVELESLLDSGSFVDAFFSFASYDYQQNAGVKLVAEKLIVHS